MEFDSFWIYLAMVAILGLRWFFEQLKRGAQRRRQMLEGTLGREEQTYQQEEGPYYEEQEPYYEERSAPTPPPIPNQQRQEQPSSAPQTLQELFEQRRQEIAKTQREVNQPKPNPTPQPKQHAPTEPVVKQPIPIGPNEIELNSPFSGSSSRKKSSNSGISKILSDRDTVRTAIILNEVIGKPKGL